MTIPSSYIILEFNDVLFFLLVMIVNRYVSYILYISSNCCYSIYDNMRGHRMSVREISVPHIRYVPMYDTVR